MTTEREFGPGAAIELSCDLAPGAFSSERLVTVRLDDETITGFVPKERTTADGESSGRVHGVVREVSGSGMTVRLPGQYFTTNGLVHVSWTWAAENARPGGVPEDGPEWGMSP